MKLEGSHYKKTIESLKTGLDSIFEPCSVLAYDPKTLLAKVRGSNSKQYRDNVPVLFPSMYLNTGMISPPAKGSTGMLFWGSENQAFLFPAAFMPPALQYTDGVIKPTGSPDRVDTSFSLENIEGGEHMLRSTGGSYVFLNNLGDVELGTPNMHRVTLSKLDGKFDVVTERSQFDVGGYRATQGPISTRSSDHVMKVLLDDTVPSWLGDSDDKSLVRDILSGESSVFEEKEFSPIFEMQAGNVYHGTTKATSSVDGSALFLEATLYKKSGTSEQTRTQVSKWELSKNGALVYTTQDSRYTTKMTIKPGRIDFYFTDPQQSLPENRTRSYSYGY